MTPTEAVRGLAGPIGKLGAAFMFDAGTTARGEELGLKTWAWYHLGRGGVLGDVDGDVVVAAFGFFPPALQKKAWDKGRAVLPPAQAAREYALACAAYGRQAFDVPSAERLAGLLLRAAEAVEPAGLPLFAGWRALVRSLTADGAADGTGDGVADGPGRLALALQVMREHRGSLHLVAVRATGVAPLQAVVSGRYGPGNAEFFGWPKPWPDPELARAEMAEAEALTDRLVEPAFAALSAEERAELVEGVRALRT